MARFARHGGAVTVLTVAGHSPPLYPEGVLRRTLREVARALDHLGVAEHVFLDVPALSVARLPPEDINARISDVVLRVRPNVLLIPFYDRHTDHRAVFESAMVVARPVGAARSIQVVAAYEVPSETFYNAPHIEPSFTPNWLVDVSAEIDVKTAALRMCKSQIGPPPHARSCAAVRALALFRGSQVGMPYAEGLHVIRMTTPPELLR